MSIMYKLISYKHNDEISFDGWEKPLLDKDFPILREVKNRLPIFEQLAEGEGILKKRLDIFKDLSGEWDEDESSNEYQEPASDPSSEIGRCSSEGTPVNELGANDELSFSKESISDDESSKSIITVTELEETVFGIRKSSDKAKEMHTIQSLKNEVDKKWKRLSIKNLTSKEKIDAIKKWMDDSNIVIQFNKVRSTPVGYEDLDGKKRYFYLTNWLDPKFYTCLDATKIPTAKDIGNSVEARPLLKISKGFRYDLQFESHYIEGVNKDHDKSIFQARAIEQLTKSRKKI